MALEFLGIKLIYEFGPAPIIEVPENLVYFSVGIGWVFSYIALNMFKTESLLCEKRLEKKNLEIQIQHEEIVNMNSHLNDLVTEKSSELDRKSRKLLDFAFFNSHQMRKPLANIQGLTNLLEVSKGQEASEEIIEKLKKSSEELDEVITHLNDILSKEKSDPSNFDEQYKGGSEKLVKKLK